MAAYLQPPDYDAYGIPCATDRQVEAASRMVDGALGRPEGLLWLPDADGEPCYMAGMTPTRGYLLPTGLTHGVSPSITLPSGQFGLASIGQAVILDRLDPDKVEACVVSAASGSTITLENTRFDHPGGATVEFGLSISEQARVFQGRTIRVSRPPLARLLSVYGRQTGCGRPDLGGSGFHGLDGLPGPGATPSWGGFPLARCDYDAASGDVQLYPATSDARYDDARIQYVAGWDYASLPAAIKQAVASLVGSQAALIAEGFSANVKLLKSGDATIERFAGAGGGASLFDSTTLGLLAPYRTYRI